MRKTPVRHIVKSHTRDGRSVKSYERGRGSVGRRVNRRVVGKSDYRGALERVRDYDEVELINAYAQTVGGGYSDTETILDHHPWLWKLIVDELAPEAGDGWVKIEEDAYLWAEEAYPGGPADMLGDHPRIRDRLLREHEEEFVKWELSKRGDVRV